jgi:hypothetical protein
MFLLDRCNKYSIVADCCVGFRIILHQELHDFPQSIVGSNRNCPVESAAVETVAQQQLENTHPLALLMAKARQRWTTLLRTT